MYFSNETQGFYHDGVGPEPPQDAVEISEDLYRQALDLRSKGKIVSISAEGNLSFENPVIIPTVPRSITPRQGLLVLSRAGLLEPVKAAIATMEGQAGEEARIEWEYATEWLRNWPLLESIASGIGLTSDQIDALFIQAAKI